MKILSLLVLALVLSGCSGLCPKPEPITVVQEVKVPVPVRCKVKAPTPPVPVTKQPAPATVYGKVAAIMKEDNDYRAYSKELEAVLASCADLESPP